MSLSGNVIKKTARWCHAARKWNLLQIITYLFNSHFCSSVPKHNLFHPTQFVPVVLILMHELWKKTRKNIFIWEVFHPLRTFTSFTTLPSTVLPSTCLSHSHSTPPSFFPLPDAESSLTLIILFLCQLFTLHPFLISFILFQFSTVTPLPYHNNDNW